METLHYVVLANGLLAVVSFVFYVLLRRETFFEANRLALWLGLIASLVLPLVQLPDWRPQPVKAVMQRTARVIVPRVLTGPPALQPDVTITFPNGRSYPAFPERKVQSGWSWQQSLLGLYLAVFIVLLGRFGFRLLSLLQLIRQSAKEPYDDFTLVRNTGVTSPFSFFGWVVLNPDHHAPDELETILRHERKHVRAGHSADVLGAELLCILFWFNPAAYLFRHLVHQTLEFSADRAVLAEGVNPQLYQYHLVKVSLAAGQSVITNHFSQSQLRSRIVMLNRQHSSPSTWLKYPLLCIAALVVATTFARPQMKALKKYLPTPTAKPVSAVDKAIQTPTKDSPLIKRPLEQAVMKLAEKPTSASETPVTSPATKATLAINAIKQDPVRVSPSPYMLYEGNYLYWIVTPKTTFDDLAVMKQEFAKHGYQMQLSEIKFDPLYAYIDRIAITVVRSAGGRTKVDEHDDDLTPIPTIAGYIGIDGEKVGSTGASRLEGRYSKRFPLYQTEAEENFPDILRKVAADDEAIISQFTASKKMEYLVLAGERRYGHLGIGFRKFDKKEIKKESSLGGIIQINSDETLSVDKAKNSTEVFINNKPVAHEEIRRIKINQLYTVAVVLGYDNSTQKRSGTEYLLFYVNEDN